MELYRFASVDTFVLGNPTPQSAGPGAKPAWEIGEYDVWFIPYGAHV